MFDNIGGKIKGLAMVATCIGILSSFLTGLIMMLGGNVIGLFVMLLGSFASWLGSLTLYGFGQLIENTDKLIKLNRLMAEAIIKTPNAPAPSAQVPVADPNTPWVCHNCGSPMGANDQFCVNCGSVRSTAFSPRNSEPWICASCGMTNSPRVKSCQVCGVTKAWSDAQSK